MHKGKAGRVYLFVCVDDASRLTHARIYPEETTASAISFLDACHDFYRGHGIRIERVLTDNGKCFKHAWDRACGPRVASAPGAHARADHKPTARSSA